MKAGRLIAIGLALAAVIGGAAAYHLQNNVYYEPRDGLTEITIGGAPMAVSDYRGLDNDALPLRLRGCFRIAAPEAAIAAGRPATRPEPFGAPGWFDCWDAAALDADLKAGRATAVVAEIAGSGEFRTERIVAIYPDGRAYQWRRLAPER